MTLKILLIDNNDGDRKTLKKNIKKPDDGVSFIEASTASSGLSHINDNDDISCVFLNYGLPDMDGISMLRQIYDESTDLAPFPVIMLTNQGSESVAIDAIRYGAQDYLIKDHISTDTLYIAMAKAREVFDLKKARIESKNILEHSQKMDAVGKLTGGIAHDFNNLLTIAFGHSKLLLDMLQSDDFEKNECIEKVKTIQKAAQRGADLVKRLMVFSRHRTLEPETININEDIADLEELLRRCLGETVEIKTQFSDDVDYIDVDPSQLEHAIINMGVNARDVMPDGGVFTLATTNICIDKEKAQKLNISPGEYVLLTARDTGYGMKPDVVDRIFDPFFTTKDSGKGSGLGLSMAYNFVQESGGAIEVFSQRGAGTRFHLYFPKSNKQPKTKSQAENAQEELIETADGQTILVVEDEDEIRTLTTMLLKESGYAVLSAANGNEALNIIQQNMDSIHLVFTDIAMPGEMNGVQMAARAQVLKPDIKLLFTSGHVNGTLPDMALAEHYPMLSKPYKPYDLMKMVQQVLENQTNEMGAIESL